VLHPFAALGVSSLQVEFILSFSKTIWDHFEMKKERWTVADRMQAAGGIISACLLSTPGASGFYKGGLTVRSLFPPSVFSSTNISPSQLYTLESRIAFGKPFPCFPHHSLY
jgi:hypothetical protein